MAYRVPVYVTVDVDSGEVFRVALTAEGIEAWPQVGALDATDDAWTPIDDADPCVEAARTIAGEAEWPTWDWD